VLPKQLTIRELYEIFVQFPVVCTDTRKIIPNSLFFCLKGANFEGSSFAKEALEKGARYVISDTQSTEIDNRMIIVENVLQTLQQLANHHRKQLTIPVIGITGSNGKTTSKELIASVLSKKYNVAFTQGNLNNHIGVPLTLLSINKDDEIAVIEMGANHPGEIENLCQIAQPDFGLITNIGKAHLEGFGTIENIIETKTALYRAAPVVFVNGDDELLKRKAQNKTIFFYGKNTDTTGRIVEMNPYLVVELFEKKLQTHLTGDYNLPNILGAAAIGKFFGVSNKEICEAVAEYKPQNQRSQIIPVGTNTLIADYYNANPTSMKAALENFLQIEMPHKLAILGDMLELGESSTHEHQAIINLCKEKNIETFFIGSVFYSMKNEHFKFFTTAEECNNYIKTIQLQNTLILLKGSRGIRLENINL